MTTMTPAHADAVWAAIDDQRVRTADLLEQLTQEQWEHPSLCQGTLCDRSGRSAVTVRRSSGGPRRAGG